MKKVIPQEFDETGKYRQGPFLEGSWHRNKVQNHVLYSKYYVLVEKQDNVKIC